MNTLQCTYLVFLNRLVTSKCVTSQVSFEDKIIILIKTPFVM